MSLNVQLDRPGGSDSGSKRESSLLLDPQKVNSKSCRSGYRYHVRKVRSRGSLFLILLWSIAVWCATFTVIEKLGPDLLPPRLALIPGAIQSVVFLLYCPFAGWLADVYFGRYKVIHANLLLIWIGSIVAVLGLILEYLFPNTATLLAYCVLFPAYVVISAGNGGFVVNVVPFGTDQMPDASAEEVSAFIAWFVWAWYVGDLILLLGNVILDCTKSLSSDEANMVHMLIAVTVLSIALCSDYLFHNWLTIEPMSQNPLKLVIDVLKYAATHKYPARRSAFTYWEEEIPSRIDLGKSKYGGPFTNEQVEDVKTFFRILVVVTSISAFIIPIEAALSNFPAAHYKATVDVSCLSTSKIHYFVLIVVLGVPFYELVIYPLAWKWIPSMLKRVGAVALVTIGLSIILMTVDAIGHAKTNADVPCMFNANSSSPKLDISYLYGKPFVS